MSVKIYQIYFDPISERNCFGVEPFVPYYNKNCSKYFENEVIKKLINDGAHFNNDWFGVFSHKFLQPNKGRAKGFAPELILPRLQKTNPDVLSFFPHLKTGFIMHNQDKATYKILFNGLMNHLGINFDVDTRSKFVVLQNHFIARSSVYEHYVKYYLNPAIDWLDTQELANTKTGYKGYTFHAFICERLFMAYLSKNKLRCEHW